MKSVFLAVSLFSFSALAIPSVGDFAKYEISQGANSLFLSQEIKAIDSNKGLVTVEVSLEQNGKSQSSVSDVDLKTIPTAAALESAIKNCVQIGGTNETVTVKAGTFETCKVPTENGTINLGLVAFGLVKVVGTTDDGQPMTAELVEARQ